MPVLRGCALGSWPKWTQVRAQPVKVYLVGGAVRDTLLGRPVTDRDWVVVGATPQEMTALGFRPVGKDFPVFLHPQTHEEYALARTERKTALGYHGFVFNTAPDVTLAQDLARRDLRINSIAQDEAGQLIDPFGGQQDLQRKLLRHTSGAFAEDPVRILRVARFAARLPDFTLAPETLQLMQDMVERGEVDALVPERVWQELAIGLMEEHPARMVDVLQQAGALARLVAAPDTRALTAAAQNGASLQVRYASWCLANNLGRRLLPRVPKECADLLDLAQRQAPRVLGCQQLDAPELLKLLTQCDGFRRPQRFDNLLRCIEYVHARGAPVETATSCAHLRQALAAAQTVQLGRPSGAITGQDMGQQIAQARIQILAKLAPAG